LYINFQWIKFNLKFIPMIFDIPNLREKRLIQWAKINRVNIPHDPAQLVNVTSLDISFKNLKALPKEIGCLVNLEEMDASYNQIADLPWEFAQLKNLVRLNLSNNLFSDIPGIVCNHVQLESLNIEGNFIKKITPVIANLSSLVNFSIGYNQIFELPIEFGHLKHVVNLDLSCNALHELPSSFVKLYNLKNLKIGGNQFAQKPALLAEMPNLETVDESKDIEIINKAFLFSVISDSTRRVEKYIALGADVNYQLKDYQNTPFTTALFEAQSLEMVKILLAYGANAAVQRQYKMTVKSFFGQKEKQVTETFLTKKHKPEIEKYLKSIEMI